MTDQEIIYKAIREVVNTDNPVEFAAHNSTCYTIAKYVCEELREELNSLPAEQPSEELENEIKNYFNGWQIDESLLPTFYNIAHHFADWQKEQIINKACEWLQKHMNDYIVHGRDIDFLYDNFRKAMEKEDE